MHYQQHPTVNPKYVAKETTPVDAKPGSQEKVEILAMRLERGEELWHPKDRTHFKDRFAWRLPVVKDYYDIGAEDDSESSV